MRPESESVSIIGAGLVGSLLAGFLARRGWQVDVYERRPDMRRETISAGRSINLAVSARGLHALAMLGIEREVLELAVPMRGRMMHALDGALTFQRYGRDDSECINSVSRGALNKLLMTHAERLGARIHFGKRAVGADLDAGLVRFEDGSESRAGCVMGTDGSASVIRETVARGTSAVLDAGYKELTIPAGPDGTYRMEKNALHIWPRGQYMLIALPNMDGSFTCTLFLQHKGALSFESLREPKQVREFFDAQFADAVIPDLEHAFFDNPTGQMVTIKCSPWHYKDRALLVGDAAHAIVPFFGQGMNCGFEDCSVLEGLLDSGATRADAFASITRLRKTNADAIADMAVENFFEMRDKVAQPRFQLQKAIEQKLQAAFPGEYVSRYALVTFSHAPYREAYDIGLVQSGILDELAQGIDRADQVDLARAGELIRAKLGRRMGDLNQKGVRNGS